MRKRVSNVRVVAGKFKGSKIPFKSSKDLRPTTNKNKETIFNWLMHDIEGSLCLDMFAGTGSMGIEAISRGASFVFFAEKNKKMYRELLKTIRNLGIKDQVKVINANSLNFPFENKIKQQLDIVFIDPPFRQDYLSKAFTLLKNKDLISSKTIISTEVEKEKELKEILLEWDLIKSKISGQTRYCLFKRNDNG